jgi:hypothetical protein
VDLENEFFTMTPLYASRRDVVETANAQPAARIRTLTEASYHELRAGDVKAAVQRCEEAVSLLSSLPKDVFLLTAPKVLNALGLARLRLGEIDNCCARHTPESCIMPIRGGGLHTKPEGSTGAIEALLKSLQFAPPDSEEFWTARWLLNVAHMTLGTWPNGLPKEHRLAADALGSPAGFPRFRNIAKEVGFGGLNHAGSAVAEDFDGDGLVDLFTSNWDVRRAARLYKNQGDGAFVERGAEAGLSKHLSGLNSMSVDYDNDGDPDVFIPRGAWLRDSGRHPKSLLRNDGGVFTEVAYEVGLGGADYPTQAAAWADYDGDGDLDLFVGSEADPAAGRNYPSQLYRNDGGKFTNVAKAAGVENFRFAKGCAWGDYDDDGDADLYVSNMGHENRLYRNNGDGTFVDVARDLGVLGPLKGFPCWFFDADNDGALDLLAAAFFHDVAPMVSGYYGKPMPEHYTRLYKNDGKGGFKDVTEEWGVTTAVPTMGANFGDLDNDGYPDFYLATGSPNYESLTPNVMFLNQGGKGFRDVTVAGGFGILQKGHGVAFADFDGDGDQDIFAETGAAFLNDTFHNALFENPGFGNHWVNIKLSGVKANRAGYGARIRAEIEENGVVRSVYKYVGCVASFGSNPAAQHLGLGKATKIRRLEVRWPRPSNVVQEFRDLDVDRAYEIVEDAAGPRLVETKRAVFKKG